MKAFMRIALDEMPKDPAPIEAGQQATVAGYDDAGNLMVSWDNGSSLGVVYGEDSCRRISG